MRHRWGRWSLLAAAVAVAAGACAWAVQLESQLRDTRTDAVTAAGFARSGRTALGDVRRALAAMASPGQAAAGWSRRAEAAIDDARRQMEGIAGLATSGTDRRAALDVLDRLAESQRRLREHATGGKPLMAADVAFGEAMPHVDDLEQRLDSGLDAVGAATEQAVAGLRDRQVAALAAAIGALLLAALMLTPVPAAAAAVTSLAPETDVGAERPAGTGDGSPVPDVAPLDPPAAVTSPARPPQVDLVALGLVCERLAMVKDAGTIPALLDEAARAIGARGAMLWLTSESRRELRVAAMAGYDTRLLDRIGPVDAADDHATARAFRLASAVTTPARGGQPAALAVPVGGTAGVVGVLAMELAADTALDLATAAGRIVAAQLSTLVTPVASDDRADGVAQVQAP